MHDDNAPAQNFDNAYGLPVQLIHECIRHVANLIPLSSCVFYLLDPSINDRRSVLMNISSEWDQAYEYKYRFLDPLSSNRFAQSGEKVVCLDDIVPEQALLKSSYYQEFMKPLDYRHVTEMFFRRDGDIIAGLSMQRSESFGEFTSVERELARKLQPFLEYTLNFSYVPKPYPERRTIQERYKLTAREVDVLDLIFAGASNKLIAKRLTVELSTVKSHLQHIFAKTQVSSRTSLLARVRDSIES
jgi:DNA-binding CsgD family transcriptional regulator